MYTYAVVIIALVVLTVISCRDLQSTNHVAYKRFPRETHANTTVVQGNGALSQKPDSRCGVVTFKCYEPILSYIDGDGEYCGWKNMTSFWTLPSVCMNTIALTISLWGPNALKYEYKFIKVCGKIQTFQKCVRNNQVCRRDAEMTEVMLQQKIYCDDIQVILPNIVCTNAWDSSVNWDKLLYTDWRIVQACPARHYRQLALNTMKLVMFTYITSPSSGSDRVANSLNAEAAGRYICQVIQQNLCLWKRGDAVCQGFLPIHASVNFYDQALIIFCGTYTYNLGKCNYFVKKNCNLTLSSGHMAVKTDFSDIRNVYNMTYWHAVSKNEVDILLHTDNKGIGHCYSSNLIFKQLGCFHQYITQMDINYANHGDYLTEYMCRNLKLYNSCFDAYINSSCPDESEQFLGIGKFLHAQCDVLRVADLNVTCPLYAVYAFMIFVDDSWYKLKMDLLIQYISVIKIKQMNQEPPGWRDVITSYADSSIRYYKSDLIKGSKKDNAANFDNITISTVCDQQAADVYNDFVSLSTGEQYYQFMKHLIKGFEYIKYLARKN